MRAGDRDPQADLPPGGPGPLPLGRRTAAAATARTQARYRATAALLATQRMQTERRAYGRAVERVLRDRLVERGFEKITAANGGRIEAPVHMPAGGRFYGECSVYGRRTDLLIGLADGRSVAVEAKDSSLVVNSVKRVLNDTAAKARHWHAKCGETLIPVALLSGVFVHSLRAAQAGGLFRLLGTTSTASSNGSARLSRCPSLTPAVAPPGR